MLSKLSAAGIWFKKSHYPSTVGITLHTELLLREVINVSNRPWFISFLKSYLIFFICNNSFPWRSIDGAATSRNRIILFRGIKTSLSSSLFSTPWTDKQRSLRVSLLFSYNSFILWGATSMSVTIYQWILYLSL